MRRLAAAVLGVALATVPPAASAFRPLEETPSFTGVVRVEWIDDDGRHVERARVAVANGVMTVDASRALAARGDARFVRQADGSWSLVWPADLAAGTSRPRPDAKYDVHERRGPVIAGRPTTVVVVEHGGELWERRYIDVDSGLVLRREQYTGGALRRVVAFEAVEARTATPVTEPGPAVDRSPRAVVFAGAPSHLADGYRLLGAYRQAGTVHLLYSDGVYDLSLFERRGRLRRGDLPPGVDRVEMGGRDAYHLRWPGGEVVVWQAGDALYTVVGEGPWEDVLAAARAAATAMPETAEPGFVDRVRRACAGLLDAFT